MKILVMIVFMILLSGCYFREVPVIEDGLCGIEANVTNIKGTVDKYRDGLVECMDAYGIDKARFTINYLSGQTPNYRMDNRYYEKDKNIYYLFGIGTYELKGKTYDCLIPTDDYPTVTDCQAGWIEYQTPKPTRVPLFPL